MVVPHPSSAMPGILAKASAMLAWGQEGWAAERQQQALWLPIAMGAGILFYFNLREEPDPRLIWLAPALIATAFILARRRPLLGWLSKPCKVCLATCQK